MAKRIVEIRGTNNRNSPWKDIIEDYFPEFMAFFLPQVAASIDWTRGYQFLDRELRKAIKIASDEQRYVDKLVKVWDGKANKSTWILLHIEVEDQAKSDFALRMYSYQYQLFDQYHRKVATFAILTDNDFEWRPSAYQYALHGSELIWRYTTIKLIDYQSQWATLAQSNNLFAVVVMAQLKALQTRNRSRQRYFWKSQLIRALNNHRYSDKQIFQLLRFIDWLMLLPPKLDEKLTTEILLDGEKQKRSYISQFELRAKDRGLQEGKLEGSAESWLERELKIILDLIQTQCGKVAKSLQNQVCALSSEQLTRLINTIPEFHQEADLAIWLEQQSAGC
jgi:hypothetical protein